MKSIEKRMNKKLCSFLCCAAICNRCFCYCCCRCGGYYYCWCFCWCCYCCYSYRCLHFFTTTCMHSSILLWFVRFCHALPFLLLLVGWLVDRSVARSIGLAYAVFASCCATWIKHTHILHIHEHVYCISCLYVCALVFLLHSAACCPWLHAEHYTLGTASSIIRTIKRRCVCVHVQCSIL